MAHYSAITATNIAAISPLVTQFKVQLNHLADSVSETDKQLSQSQQQFIQGTRIINSLYQQLDSQWQHWFNLTQQNEQQALQIHTTHTALEKTLSLLKESGEKTEASNLFVRDLNKISMQLEQLSHDFKLDEKENRTRRGNDKRLYPRINNQLTVTLQQTAVTFIINLPSREADSHIRSFNLLGDVVHYEQQGNIFYYGVHFRPLSEQQKSTLQEIFDYFEKTSEFKHATF